MCIRDRALVDELLEGLAGGEVAQVKENLVPEAGIEQVEHGVFPVSYTHLVAQISTMADSRR